MIDHPLYWTLRALARLERAGGVRVPRLTEPDHARWHRYRRKLGWRHFVELLHEDLAAAFPYPFDTNRWAANPWADLDDETGEILVLEALDPDDGDTQLFLRNAARGLGLPPGGRIADLPKVQPHHRVLELPGAAGRIAAHQALRHDLSFGQAFTFVADTDAERVLIGLAAVELRASPPTVIASDGLSEHTRNLDAAYGVPCEAARTAAARHDLEVRWA